jgi:hypothetical protein
MRCAIIFVSGFGFKNVYSGCFCFVLLASVKAADWKQPSSPAGRAALN